MNEEPVSNPSVLMPQGLTPVGELLRNSAARYRAQWKLFVLILLPAALLSAVHAFFFPPTPASGPEEFNALAALLGGLLVVVQFVSALALLTAVRETVTVGEAYRRGIKILVPYIFIAILSGVVIGGGFLLFIVPGIFFALWFGFAPYILVSEGTRGMDALLKSKAYVTGHTAAVLGRLLVLLLVAVVMAMALGLVLPEPLYTFLISLFFGPLATIYCFKLYEELKAVKGSVPETYSIREKAKYLAIGLLGFTLILGFVAFGVTALLQGIALPN